MEEPKRAPMKVRKDIGEVVFPIEKLMATREVSFSCVHVEAILESRHDSTSPIKDPSRSAVTVKKDPK